MAEKPSEKKENPKVEKKKEEEDADTAEKGKSLLVDKAREMGNRMIDRTREVFGSDGGSPEQQEKIKAASKAMGNVKFGLRMLGAGIFLALAGSVALPFWGMKKILEADRDFMKGFNLMKQ